MKWFVLFVALMSPSCAMRGMAVGADVSSGWMRDGAPTSDAPSAPTDTTGGFANEPAAGRVDDPAPRAVESAVDRQVVYSAMLRLVVVSTREAHTAIADAAKQAGGYLQQSDARSITIRVPAAAFERVVAQIGGIGEVVDSNVRASDVTEEMLDLGIRLDNAKKARERLLEHLAKSQKVEDTLKIEVELTRVTGEIEQMEGRLRYMQSQIAMSTIRVELNTNEPQRSGDGLDLPFDWIGRLGDGLVAGTVKGMPKKPQFFSRGPRFDPPPEFVRYYSSNELVEAMNASGVRLKLQVQENFDEGALAFWSTLARKSLVRSRSLAVAEEHDLGDGRAWMRGTRTVGAVEYGYMLVLMRTDDRVYTFEAWGPQDAFSPLVPALLSSAKSLRR